MDDSPCTLRGTIRSVHPERGHLYVRLPDCPHDVLVKPDVIDNYEQVKSQLVIGATLEFVPLYLLRAARARLIE